MLIELWLEFKVVEAHLEGTPISPLEAEMLYKAPTTRSRVVSFIKAMLAPRRHGAVTDLRDLGTYLRSDIGMSDENYPFRKGN